MKRWMQWLVPVSLVASLHAQPTMNDPFNDPFFQDPFGDDIFKEMMRMQRHMDELFKRMQTRIYQRQSRMAAMPLSHYGYAMQGGFVDKGDHYELYTHIPQSKNNEIHIKTVNGMLDISAKIVREEKQNNNGYVSMSHSEQMVSQSLTLPVDADENKVSTAFEKGMLVVKIAKKPTSKVVTPASKDNTPKVTIQTPANTSSSTKTETKNPTTKPEANATTAR